MDIIFNNFEWIIVNVFLALLPVIFARGFIKSKSKFIKIIFLIAWFLFIPNSIYLITDLQYLPRQITNDISLDILLSMQYFAVILLGVLSYLYSIYPITNKIKGVDKNFFVIIFNFLISFAVMMGKIQRTESWYVITQPARFLTDIERNLHTPEILILTFLFGVLINIIYFSREIF